MRGWISRLRLVALVIAAVLMGCEGIKLSPRQPGSLSVVTDVEGVAQVGSEFTLEVEVRDESDDPLLDIPVQWQVIAGDGSVTESRVMTDPGGRASTIWKLGPTAGRQAVEASVRGLSPVTFEVSSEPGDLASIRVSPGSISFDEIGEERQLTISGQDEFGNEIEVPEGGVDWSSTDELVAIVTQLGKVRSIGVGETEIIARYNDLSERVAVSVTSTSRSLASIVIEAEMDTVIIGGGLQLNASGFDEDGEPFPIGKVAWGSSDEAIATINEDGYVSTSAGGEVTLTASFGGVTGEFYLVVQGRIHYGVIDEDEVWLAAEGPHWVQSSVTVTGESSPLLTIEAGAEVRLHRDAAIYAHGGGGIAILGTASAPVILTSAEPSPAPGDWGVISISGRSPRSQISHAVMEFCGDKLGCLELSGPYGEEPLSIKVEDLLVRKSAGRGVVASNAAFAPGSKNLSVQDTEDHAIVIHPEYAGTLPEGGEFSGGGSNTIFVWSGEVSTSQRWPNLGIPYVIGSGTFMISGPTLTISAGTELQFEEGASVWVYPGAKLEVDGTAAAPVHFTAAADADRWVGLEFSEDTSVDAIPQFTHLKLSRCGGKLSEPSACIWSRRDIFVDDVVIEGSSGYGVQFEGGAGFAEGSTRLAVNGAAGYPIRIRAGGVGALPDLKISGGTTDYIYIDPENIHESQTWRNHGVPYVLGAGSGMSEDSLVVWGPDFNLPNSTTLTLEPGVNLRMEAGASIQAVRSGRLVMQGTAEAPIVVTAHSEDPAPGYWGSIELSPSGSLESEFSYLTLEYGTSNLILGVEVYQIPHHSTFSFASECGVRWGHIHFPPDLKDPALSNRFEGNLSDDICVE